MTQSEQLSAEGYLVAPKLVPPSLLASLNERFGGKQLEKSSKESFGDSGGFVRLSYHDPLVVELLTLPTTLAQLSKLGFARPKLHSFYVSTKPPKAKALDWHSDLFYPYALAEPAELFLIYYLQDTSPQNGCLRVIPGSHLDPKTTNLPMDLPVKAGDLFVGDRRILHATRSNNSEEWRTCITIAWAPDFDNLAESIQAMIVQNNCLPPKGWADDPNQRIDPRLRSILPIYNGSARPANEKIA